MRAAKITVGQCKDTGLAILLIALLVISLQRSMALVGPAILVLILTMTAPKLLSPLARLWFAFSHYLGEIVSTILLTIVFFVVVTPMGLIRRLSGKDAMGLTKWRAGRQSVLIKRDHTFSAADLEKPF
ncbi:MAG: SxtJ family membrane protein [Desulfobulbaceae bacterium]|nr:SxtJ family membrane protein [Desulfobulbaceae bacterium]